MSGEQFNPHVSTGVAPVEYLDRMIAEGRAYPGKGGNLADLGPPIDIGPGPTLSEVLQQMRDEDDR